MSPGCDDEPAAVGKFVLLGRPGYPTPAPVLSGYRALGRGSFNKLQKRSLSSHAALRCAAPTGIVVGRATAFRCSPKTPQAASALALGNYRANPSRVNVRARSSCCAASCRLRLRMNGGLRARSSRLSAVLPLPRSSWPARLGRRAGASAAVVPLPRAAFLQRDIAPGPARLRMAA